MKVKVKVKSLTMKNSRCDQAMMGGDEGGDCEGAIHLNSTREKGIWWENGRTEREYLN